MHLICWQHLPKRGVSVILIDALVRMAWHLGNRHLPTDVTAERLRIRPDHVIEALARGMGARVESITAPFQPEGGAYDDHGHDH